MTQNSLANTRLAIYFLVVFGASAMTSAVQAQPAYNPEPAKSDNSKSFVKTAPTQGEEIFHPGAIPIGTFNFYERALKKNVSYVRTNNEIVGALYSAAKPDIFTCFKGVINPDGVDVLWWRNLEQIGQSKGNNYQRFYTINDFTADNVNLKSGINNPNAIKTCTQQVIDR